MNERLDYQLSHGLARLGIGVNIALHGLTRIPKLAAFTASLHEEFGKTVLPPALIQAAAYGIVASETTLGILLLLGLWQRAVFTGGALLMCVLTFGTCLIQNWPVAGGQLVYLAFFAVLLATRRFDRFSIDGWLRNTAVT